MKKTTRISALILILVLLMNICSAALATSEGIPIEDLDLADLNMLTMAALEEEETDDAAAEYGDLEFLAGECGEDNPYCGYVKHMLEDLTTAQQRYDYMMELYNDPDDVVALEFTMLHYYLKEVHSAENLLCTCAFPSYMPEYKVGIIVDEDGNAVLDEDGNEVKHAEDCPWNFNNLSIAEQYELVSTADEALAAEFADVMSTEAAEKLSRVNANEYMAEAGAATVQIVVPENTFEEDYILTANESTLSAEESAALAAEEANNVLAAFDISFPNLDETKELQPVDGASVPLTFTVDVSSVEGNSVRVFHIKDDGAVEFVGEPVAIEEGAESLTIEVAAESFSKWGIDLWGDNPNEEFDDTTPEYFPVIGFLDKEKYDEFVFFVDHFFVGGQQADEIVLSAGECPDYLVINGRYTSNDGSKVLYMVDSYDDAFYNSVILANCNFVYSEYFSEVVAANELSATVPADLSGEVKLYKNPNKSNDYKSVSALEIAGEYAVEAMEAGMELSFKLMPAGEWPTAADYCWVKSTDIVRLGHASGDKIEEQLATEEQWGSDTSVFTLTYNYDGAVKGETYIYTWYQADASASWQVVAGDAVTDNKLTLNVTETDYAALAKAYKCVVTDGNGKLYAVSTAQNLVNDEIDSWLTDKTDEITVTMEMAQRAYEVGALDKLRVEESELISVYSGEAVADIVEHTEIEGIAAKLVDRSMGLTVAYVTADGMVVSVDSVEPTEVETTNE